MPDNRIRIDSLELRMANMSRDAAAAFGRQVAQELGTLLAASATQVQLGRLNLRLRAEGASPAEVARRIAEAVGRRAR
jgi:hypothetical protein